MDFILLTMFTTLMHFLMYLAYFIDPGSTIMCWFSGCCLDAKAALEGLEKDLTESVFGQHLVLDPIFIALKSHYEHNPKKALVLSFHGPAGVGKTYVAKKIGDHIFAKKSYYVKFYSGTNDFAESLDIALHKERLAKEIRETVSSCAHSIFIFDEANNMADGLFDIIRPFADFLDEYKGVDYRKVLFIFLSNTGASEISEIYYNRKGTRQDLTHIDFEGVLAKQVFNLAGGFRDTSMVKNFLVDYYIPFLPLEKEHIIQCIEMAFREEGVPSQNERVRFVYNQLPKKMRGNVEYVPSNCKKVHTEVGKYIASIRRRGKLDEL